MIFFTPPMPIAFSNSWMDSKAWLQDVVNWFATILKGIVYASTVSIRIVREGVAEIIYRTYVPTEDNNFGEIVLRKLTAIPKQAQNEIDQEVALGTEVKVTGDMAQRLGLI